MTGRHGFRTGVGQPVDAGQGTGLRDDELTLPRLLDAAGSGYSHANFGKWHLGGEDTRPNDMGWSHFSGLIGGGLRTYSHWTKVVDGQPETVNKYATTEIVDDAISWITKQNDPWFAWVGFTAPHTPFHLPPDDLHNQALSGSPADIEANPTLYYNAAIEAMDTEIGRLLDSLDQADKDNTVVIFIGDNGNPTMVSDHGRGRAKGSLAQGGIHVPMMIWGAGIDQGLTIDVPVGTIDLHNTILDLAGVDLEGLGIDGQPVDSVSLIPLLGGVSDSSHRPRMILSEQFGVRIRDRAQGRAIRDETYKLIMFSDGRSELYNLGTDPAEKHPITNLSDDDQAALDRLKSQLSAWS